MNPGVEKPPVVRVFLSGGIPIGTDSSGFAQDFVVMVVDVETKETTYMPLVNVAIPDGMLALPPGYIERRT